MAPNSKITLPHHTSHGRVYFTQQPDDLPAFSLVEMQIDSYSWFIKQGIKDLFDEINPVTDVATKTLSLKFLSHEVGQPKYTVPECKRKSLTYEGPLNMHVQLVNKETGEIKEQEVFMGSVPLMTDQGTFIINGIERVVTAQIHRSPGVFFDKNPNVPGKSVAKIIPNRGAWLEIETDKNGVLTVKIDRKRKIPLTALLRAFGMESDQQIMETFSSVNTDINIDYIAKTLEKDPTTTTDEALIHVYKKIRPGDMATPENARSLLEGMFFDFRRYDLSSVGRYKINKRLGVKLEDKAKYRVFQLSDLVEIISEMIRINNGESYTDDIDSLENRRVRPVGELVQNKFRVGMLRMERIARDRMTIMDMATITPQQLVNSHPITASLKEFFSSSQLSQFMDQTNPLSELEHKRRLSAMGPGGLSRERASFDVRDLHSTHYGRICPIQSPEGPNIGLVVHLASYAKLDKYGFITTPYRKIERTVRNTIKDLEGRITDGDITDGRKKVVKSRTLIDKDIARQIGQVKDLKEVPVRAFLTDQVAYYDVAEEKEMVVAQASVKLDEMKQFEEVFVSARDEDGEAAQKHFRDVTHIDISPKQIFSISTAMIPFLEHNDNVRAAMGANQQRQALPLIRPESPVVGTGVERKAALDSGQVVVASEAGEVASVDGKRIVIITSKGKEETYDLYNFVRSNHGTLMHQRPVVSRGDKVTRGQVIAEGSCSEGGEIALGKNLMVAYMPWRGYNYEDAIIISEKVAREGWLSSVHIDDMSIDVRETKLGSEIITRDIPNVGEDKMRNLDEDGIIRIGAEVTEGDILVGKITPKGETELTPEERLLRAIFGDKAHDVKDSSMRLPNGQSGKVIDVQIFTRKDGAELPTGVSKRVTVWIAQIRRISVGDKLAGRHGNKGVISQIVPTENMPYMEDGTPVDIILNPLGVISRMNIGQLFETHLGWAASKLGIKVATPVLNSITEGQIQKLMKAADLPVDGKVQLYDGMTGKTFDNKTTVGVKYFFKLNHLVGTKIHARSVGPYSLVTQQPLGGKAQNGGQRFGEMEVWALEAYGAAHTLQEMLTIKSDDVFGRGRAYESIIKNEEIRKPNTPAAFNVLMRELQACGLDPDLIVDEERKVISSDQGDDEVISNEISGIFDEAQEEATPDDRFDNPSGMEERVAG